MEISKKAIKRRERRMNFYRQIGAACVVCGQTEPLFLDFHHVGTKRAKISTLLNRSIDAPLSNWPRLLQAELRECVPLCVMCHRKVHGGWIELTEEQKARRVEWGSLLSHATQLSQDALFALPQSYAV